MTIQIFHAPFAAWLLYCVWRVVTAPRDAIRIDTEVVAQCPVGDSFQTYMKVREFYLQLSSGHKKYEMHGNGLTPETIIDIWEEAGYQFVKHKYRVTKLVPRQRMCLVSEASQVRILGLFRSQSRSEVEFRFREAEGGKSILGLTICIVFPNKLRHLLARLFFTQVIWQRHAEEEMNALARLVETRYREDA